MMGEVRAATDWRWVQGQGAPHATGKNRRAGRRTNGRQANLLAELAQLLGSRRGVGRQQGRQLRVQVQHLRTQ